MKIKMLINYCINTHVDTFDAHLKANLCKFLLKVFDFLFVCLRPMNS